MPNMKWGNLSVLRRARLVTSDAAQFYVSRLHTFTMRALPILLLAADALTNTAALSQSMIRFPGVESTTSPIDDREFSKDQIAALMRPTFGFEAEWQAKSSDIELTSYDARIQFPTYPFFGPPPPMIGGGFSYTKLAAPLALDLPTDLYDYSLGASWMRPINDHWILRFMASAAFASDGRNTTSDALQFRGGAFAMYRPNDRWAWIFGAIALGRNDLPVVPAVGVIWQPNPQLRFDLTLPRPRVAFLVADQGLRQQWGYVGGGFTGGTWAYERTGGATDQLSYGDWRVVVGWESTPTPEPGMPFTRGRKIGVETGYVFGRDLEFDSGAAAIQLDDTWMVRGWLTF